MPRLLQVHNFVVSKYSCASLFAIRQIIFSKSASMMVPHNTLRVLAQEAVCGVNVCGSIDKDLIFSDSPKVGVFSL
jgi:hypothetical protein